MHAFAAHARRRQEVWRRDRDQQFAQALSLTDAQKAPVAAKQANDTAKLDTMKPAMEAQRAQMKQIRAAEDAQIAKVLTAEQNAKWQQLKAEHAQKEHRQ